MRFRRFGSTERYHDARLERLIILDPRVNVYLLAHEVDRFPPLLILPAFGLCLFEGVEETDSNVRFELGA